MNIAKIIETLPEKSTAERARMRENADRWLTSGTPQQKAAAKELKDAMDNLEAQERDAVRHMPVAERVVQAFTKRPPSETEEKLLRVLLDNPGSTSSALTQAIGWRAQSRHLHFGTMCQNREADLWPAEKSGPEDKGFFSGILAEFEPDGATFTMKPEVVGALAQLGIHAKARA
ncbi:hypothetical protein CDZ97_26095 [Mameliella alba]|uniref:hypothetical protein n=1 Tax=Mameliella alba TaxID=561184 RepID=UPI000B531811|nr:hypothetical protein [Mameliella alba]OWV52438.1 hypothetical protein CDZ97_26095 [Mameliella alba]